MPRDVVVAGMLRPTTVTAQKPNAVPTNPLYANHMIRVLLQTISELGKAHIQRDKFVGQVAAAFRDIDV